MAEKINATCSICGKGYYKCLSCKDKMIATPWKVYTDTSEHYKIHQVIHGFSIGLYSKEEAKEKLQAIDLSDMNDFMDNIKKIIKNIMKEEKKAVVKVVESDSETEIISEEIVVPDIIDELVEDSYIGRKKKYSK